LIFVFSVLYYGYPEAVLCILITSNKHENSRVNIVITASS